MVGQDHLLEWQPKLYIRSVFHSSSMPENWANNIRQIFTHNHHDSQNPDEEFSLVSALKHHDMTWHDIMKNAYWFATIPTVGNQHSASARFHHLLNVFRLLGKTPAKEELLDNANVKSSLPSSFHGCNIKPFLGTWRMISDSLWSKPLSLVIGRTLLTRPARQFQSPYYSTMWRKLVVADNTRTSALRKCSVGLGLLGNHRTNYPIAPGRIGPSPGVQKPDGPQRSASNKTLCCDSF